DVELVGLLLELLALDEVLDGLVLERPVLRRAGLREGALLRLVAPLRLRDQRVELLLRDRLVADLCDGVARDVAATAPASTSGQDRGERHKKKRVREVTHYLRGSTAELVRLPGARPE